MIRRRKATSSSSTSSSPQPHADDESSYDGAKGRQANRYRRIDYSYWDIIVISIAISITLVTLILMYYPRSDNLHGKEKLIRRDACGCFPHDGSGARIAYLISLHNRRTLDDSLVLLKSLSAPSNIFLIHIDTKLSQDEYELSDLKYFIEGECKACGARVVVESKFDLKWGQWSMNHPTHWSMTEFAINPLFLNAWDVYINLSADTLPVYTPQVISNMFDPRVDGKKGRGILHGMNFVTSSSTQTGLVPTNINTFPSVWHKRGHYESRGSFNLNYTDDDGMQRTEDIVIHFGSQWMMLTPEFVKYIALSLQRHDSLASRFKETLIAREIMMSDETFIPTLLAHHSRFKETIPKIGDDGALVPGPWFDSVVIKSVRYERMDENVPDAFGNVVHEQKYDVPDSVTDVDIPRKWGPYYLGVYDLASIRENGALFIRKASRSIDPNLFHILPVQRSDDIPFIRWPSEIKISEKIDWIKLLEYTRRMRGE